MPLLGDSFTEMTVQTTRGVIDLPSHYKGKWFVLFSHPADFTPVCTTEFIAFQQRYDKLKALNCELIGLSVDQVFAHIKWEEWIKEKMDEILRVVEAMQISDKNKVAMPANWPNNEILKDHVIIPPATDINTAKERIKKVNNGEFECYDWWFCHKKLK